MHLEHIQQNFEKRRIAVGLQATLPPGATAEALKAAEDRLGAPIPDQVRRFYTQHNGISVDDPPFEIIPVDALSVDAQSRIHFATADGVHRIGFDASHINEAEQWDIIELQTGDRITFTMASFWANKMWKWIDHRLEFCRGDVRRLRD